MFSILRLPLIRNLVTVRVRGCSQGVPLGCSVVTNILQDHAIPFPLTHNFQQMPLNGLLLLQPTPLPPAPQNNTTANIPVVSNILQDSKKLYTVYKLICNDRSITEVFIGYTTETALTLAADHKGKCNRTEGKQYNRRIYQVIRANGGLSNWSTVILDKEYLNNAEEARKKKKEWIANTPNDINMKCPHRTVEEHKEYYDKVSVLYMPFGHNHLYYSKLLWH